MGFDAAILSARIGGGKPVILLTPALNVQVHYWIFAR
jgi:hypothetical protein